MAEMKLRNVAMIGCAVVFIGVIALAFMGVIGIGWLNQKNLKELANKGLATATGYGSAKTPVEAMDYFHKAIQAREYTIAANYTTKEYGEQLKRAHEGAAPLGRSCDAIRTFAIDKGFLNDRLTFALNKLDPFPKNFKVGPAPVVTGDKATGTFVWEPLKYDTPNALPQVTDGGFAGMDPRMLPIVPLLIQPIVPLAKIDLVKEGDEWKLAIPSNPAFEANVTYFISKQKAYNTALGGFVTDMNRLRNASKAEFEAEVYTKLRESK